MKSGKDKDEQEKRRTKISQERYEKWRVIGNKRLSKREKKKNGKWW